jgi:hypothetical protein
VEEHLVLPRKAERGDAVAVVYPCTRHASSPKERARDLNAAFADPNIRAVLAVPGGDDQITVIPHLDPMVVRPDSLRGCFAFCCSRRARSSYLPASSVGSCDLSLSRV